MQSKPRRIASVLAVLSLALLVAMAGGAEAKKKKTKKAPNSNFANVTKVSGAPIPDYVTAPAKPLDSTIDLSSKAYKGKIVGDVNVTVQTTGNVAGAANDLTARLSSPTGRTITLFTGVGGSQASIGPLTLDDDTRTLACNQSTVAQCTDTDPFATLPQPFAGTAAGFNDGLFVPLDRFYGNPMRGVWTLSIWDFSAGGLQTSALTKWALQVRSAN